MADAMRKTEADIYLEPLHNGAGAEFQSAGKGVLGRVGEAEATGIRRVGNLVVTNTRIRPEYWRAVAGPY